MAHVRRTKRRDGTLHERWRFQYVDHLGRRREGTGTTDKRQTEQIARQIEDRERQIRLGVLPVPKKADKPTPFAEIKAKYLEYGNTQGGRKGHAWGKTHARNQEARLSRWERELGLNVVQDLDGSLARVEAILRNMRGELSDKTVNDFAAVLSGFCVWAVDRGYLAENPLRNLKPFRAVAKSKRRALTVDELTRLLEKAPEERRILYMLAACSGFRAEEIRNLTVGHLSHDRTGTFYDAEWTKNRESGFQELPSWLVETLSEHVRSGHARERYERIRIARQSRHDPKATVPDDPLVYVPSHTAREFRKDLRRAAVPEATSEGTAVFHSLRHTFVTLLDQVGASESEQQQLARHAPSNITRRVYSHVEPDRRRQLVEQVGEIVRQALEGRQSGPEDGTRAEPIAVGSEGFDPGVSYDGKVPGSIPAASTNSTSYDDRTRSGRSRPRALASGRVSSPRSAESCSLSL